MKYSNKLDKQTDGHTDMLPAQWQESASALAGSWDRNCPSHICQSLIMGAKDIDRPAKHTLKSSPVNVTFELLPTVLTSQI